MGRIVFGIILGILLAPVALLAWFHWGHPPVAVGDQPLPFEGQITHFALDARIAREKPAAPITGPDTKSLVAGALIYRDQCAACHGFYGKTSSFAAHMYPRAPQLWEKHEDSFVVGVSDDPPGETYWKVAEGIRLSGMPSFNDVLAPAQIWEVSLLLANANKPLPPEVMGIVRGGASTVPVAQTSQTPAQK